MAGIETSRPGDAPLQTWRARLDVTIGPASTVRPRPRLRDASWPATVKRVLDATDEPKRVRDMLTVVAQGGGATANDALRALEVLLMAGLITIQ
jgi:hypothetical protein